MEGLETRLRLEVCFGGHGEDLVGIFVTAAVTATAVTVTAVTVTAAVTAVVAFAAATATATATATVAVPWAVSAISYKNDTPVDVPV